MICKVCGRCHQRKKITEFHKDKTAKDGYCYQCKNCVKKCTKKYYQQYKSKIKKKVKKYREENREHLSIINKTWRIKNKDKIKIQKKKWWQKYKKKYKSYNKEYKKLHPWYSHYVSAQQRCNNPHNDSYKFYGAKGIKMLMIPNDLKYLWFRDKAYLLKQVSIDRKDSNGNYILENCRFIELIENVGRNYV